MTFQGLDGTKLLLLMAMGGLFALAGIYLLFRPPSKDGETRIELFGMKFNASSGGLLVFMVGAVLLAAPIFVPERPGPQAITHARAGVPAPLSTEVPGQRVTGITVEAAESEANNSIASANRVALGSAIGGELPKGDVDYYVLDIPADTTGEIVANVVVGSGDVRLTLFDDGGEALVSERGQNNARASAPNATVSAPLERPSYYVLVSNQHEGNSRYQLTIAARPE